MDTKNKIAVLYHIFYEDSHEHVCKELEPLLFLKTTFLFNICQDTPGKNIIYAALRKRFPNCHIVYTSNKGKDIGAKLVLLELFLQLKIDADYLLFLHDKKSLQALKSVTWKEDLLKIISSDNIQTVFKIFQENKNCGIVATEQYIIKELVEEGQFIGHNGNFLEELILKYQLQVSNYSFVAGTMFWVRTKPVKDFFTKYNALNIRKSLEDGNVLDNFSGTLTHAWERVLSWVITSQQYIIKGIC